MIPLQESSTLDMNTSITFRTQRQYKWIKMLDFNKRLRFPHKNVAIVYDKLKLTPPLCEDDINRSHSKRGLTRSTSPLNGMIK